MAADLYAEWLCVAPGKRPPNHFELLGVPVDTDDPAVIEGAAREQAQRIRTRVDSASAEPAKALMQEITRARAVLLDPAKRAAYRSSLAAKPAAGEAWWKQEVMPSAGKPRPVPVQAPATVPPADNFAEIDDGIRRRRKKSAAPLILVLFAGAGLLVAVAAAVAAIVIFGNPSAPTEQAKQPATTPDAVPTSRHEAPPRAGPEAGPEVRPAPANPPVKSSFVSKDEPLADAAPKPAAPKAFKRHEGLVQALAISPRQHRFLSAGGGGVIEWEISTDRLFQRHAFRTPAIGAAYLADGKQALCADEGTILLIDLTTNEVKATLKNPRGNLLCLVADPDGKHFITGASDGTVRWWDIAAGTPDQPIELGDGVSVASVVISPDRRLVAAGASDGSVSVFQLNGGKQVWREKHHKDTVTAVAFSPDGARLASAGLDGVVALWNSAGGKPVNLPGSHADGALCVAFLKNGPGLISGGRDKTLRFWNYESGHLLRSSPTPEVVHALAAPAHGAFVIFSGNGGMVQLLPMPALDLETIAKEEPPEKKLAAPNAAEIDEARTALRDKFKAALASAKPEELDYLANRWLARAGGKAEAPERWVMFRESIDAFVKLGKPAAALKAIAEMARWFQVDELVESANALEGLTKSADVTGQKEIVDVGLKLLPRIDAESRADLVAPVLEAVTKAAEKSGAPDVIKRVAAVTVEREKAAKAKGRRAELEAKLKTSPDDRAANLEYGLLLGADDRWADALAHIAKGNDADLAQLARRDLGEPKEPRARADLGYAWAEAANRLRDGRVPLLERAKYWLEQAQNGLMGEEKTKLILKLGRITAELTDARPPKPKDLPAGGAAPPGAAKAAPPTPPKPGEVRRSHYNSFNGETVFKSNWTPTGKTRWEATGLRLQDGGGGFDSKFLLVDNWRIEILWDSDSRTGTVEVNGQSIPMPPTGPRPSLLVIERAGKRLIYQRAISSRRMGEATLLELSGDNLAPSKLTVQIDGRNILVSQPEGTLVRAVVIDGRTRPIEEPEKKEEKKDTPSNR